MTPTEIKYHLAGMGDDARRLTSTFAAVSVALRYADECVITDLCTATPIGFGLEDAAQRVRLELAALDRALELVGVEMVARRQRMARARQNVSN